MISALDKLVPPDQDHGWQTSVAGDWLDGRPTLSYGCHGLYRYKGKIYICVEDDESFYGKHVLSPAEICDLAEATRFVGVTKLVKKGRSARVKGSTDTVVKGFLFSFEKRGKIAPLVTIAGGGHRTGGEFVVTFDVGWFEGFTKLFQKASEVLLANRT